MTLAPGTRLGEYEIEGPVGSGGMGEVYRARDLALGRAVAVKVLPEHLDSDAELRARFEREARAVAALSHPNILAIHHFGRDAERWFAVTELLNGQTLRERLRQGPISLRKQLRIGRALAEGLAAAHGRGVIHRDLKPENVFLTQDGRVKILDFGLAVWVDPASDQSRDSAPTRTGIIVGTAGYLSPEQARCDPLDERSDIFSLGCLMYEMLAGQPAFVRGSPVESLVAVIQEEPAAFPPEAPPELAQLVRHCLEKDREERVQKAHDVALFLDAMANRGSGLHPIPGETIELRRPPAPPASRALALAAAGAGIAVTMLAAWLMWPRPTAPPELRYLTYTGSDRAPAASPDGRLVAFVSERDGLPRIWLKQIGSGDETPVTVGRDDLPRFSPDGSAILFTRTRGLSTSLYRVATVGGEPRRLVDDATDGDWSPDGERIAFVRWVGDDPAGSEIGTATADGSDLRRVATLEGRRVVHPRWSPDGRSLAVVDHEESPRMGLLVVDVASGAVRELPVVPGAASLSAPVWTAESDALLVGVTGAVTSRHGASTRVVRQPAGGGAATTLFWNAALNGVMDRLGGDALVLEARSPRTELLQLARPVEAPPAAAPPARPTKPLEVVGAEAPVVARPQPEPALRRLTRGSAADRQPVYSPDGRRIVFSSNRSGNLDLWALDLAAGSLRRLTDHAAEDWDPAFLPDGRLLWSSNRSGVFEIWVAEADGTRPRQLTHDGVRAENPTATPDGRWVVYNSRNPERAGLWRIDVDGKGDSQVAAGFARLPEVSPDGRHVLYLTDIRLDRLTLRAAPLDGPGPTFDIPMPSEGGRARWLPDGSAVAFTAPGPEGRLAVYLQDFAPGRDTTASRRLLPGQDLARSADSFGISRDGSRVCIAVGDELSHLMIALGV